MKTVEMDHLRSVVQGLAVGGSKPVNNALVYQALALETEEEKARVRRRLNEMVQRKELTRTSPGQYTFNPQAAGRREGEGYTRMWRAVRASRASFLYGEIAAVAHVDASSVSKYCKFLRSEGFIRLAGKKGRSTLLSITAKGREQRETPFPPLPIKVPYEAERRAVSRLARLFFESPDLGSVSEKICTECRTILARFDTQNEKGGAYGDDE